jgi:hypothetical protein
VTWSGHTICWGVALCAGLWLPSTATRPAIGGQQLPALAQGQTPGPPAPSPTQAPGPPSAPPAAPPPAGAAAPLGTPPAPSAPTPDPLPYTVAWTQPFTDTATPELLVTSALVITAGGGAPMQARDREHGMLVWTTPRTSTRALVASATLLFSAEDAHVVATDPATGHARWQVAADETVRALTLTDTALLYANRSEVRALRQEDGATLWQHPLHAPAASRVTVDGGLAVVALEDRTLVAVDTASGTERWRTTLDAVPATLVASHGRVFFSLPDLALCTIDLSSGDTDWCYRRLAIPAAGAPVVTDRWVYLVLMDNTLRVLHRGSGAMQKLEQLGDRAIAGPIQAGVFLVVPLRTGAFTLVGADGRLRSLPPAAPETVQTLQRVAVSPDGSLIAGLTVSVSGTRLLAAYRLTATPGAQ